QASAPRKRRHRIATAIGVAWHVFPAPSLDCQPVLWREWHRNQPTIWGASIWAMYFLSAFGFTVLAICQSPGVGLGRDIAPLVNAFQVAIGLLLLSVTSVTGLSEERVRGTLEILLTTPVSTKSIVRGKWWGAYRAVLPQAVLPVALVGASAASGNFWGMVLIAGLILAYGAAVTSVGLAMAIWVAKPGRAIALSVA